MRFKREQSAIADKIKFIMDVGVRTDLPDGRSVMFSVAVVPQYMNGLIGVIKGEPEFEELAGKYKEIVVRPTKVLVFK